MNFDSDELYKELNPSAEFESEEERDHRHMLRGTQERKRRRRPRSNSHFLVGDDKVGDLVFSPDNLFRPYDSTKLKLLST